ncbi:MAG TPA: hypothetical protein VI997_10925, partial [Candidatus Thermoplasmatota archaeon]|nr:hypothetical protein [Candidatus Thermoplasmatota archaeon]
ETAAPIAALAAGLQELGDAWTPQAHIDLTRDYLAAVGLARMSTAAERRLEENATVAFSYEIGDVDGDGVEDVLLDDYCVDYDVCYGYGAFPSVLLDWTVSGDVCGSIHRVEAVSGANGTLLWEKDLTVIVPLYRCGDQFVIGTVPTASGVGVLVYRIVATNPAVIWTESVIDHTIYLVDAATGETRWEFTERGVRAGDLFTTETTDSLVVNPILMVPPSNGVSIVPEGTQPALFLQGVGYVSSTAHSLLAPPGAGRPLTLLDAYHPREWAARLDIETGEVLWRVETFAPEPGESVLPQILDQPAYEPDWYLPDIAYAAYWNARSCCLDTTGDGVPDVAYRVLEWSSTPSSKVDEDLFLDSRVVTLDGVTGDVVLDRYIAEDIAVPPRGNRGSPDTFMRFTLQGVGYEAYFELLGDVDGDGAGDYLQHQVFYRDQYWHVLSAMSGKDATELWRVESPRDLRAFVLGDADGDGGNDVMLVDWYGWERRQLMYSELVTPGRTLLTLYEGRDGHVLWRTETFAAPIDAVQTFLTMRSNGLADLDGDGVADVVVDDPLYLGDQTVVHRLSWLSGRDAGLIASSEVVGAFAIPSRIADVTGDGLDDVTLLSGDINDLWLTVSEGTTGKALWSRRILAVPSSGYAEALPNLRFHVLEKADGSAPDLVTNLHMRMRMMATGTYIYISNEGGGTGERTYTYQTLWPQILHAQGANGRIGWAFPSFDDPVRLVSVLGETPGTAVWHRLLEKRKADVGDVAAALPATGAGAGSFLGAFGAVFLVGRAALRRRREESEVPDLA